MSSSRTGPPLRVAPSGLFSWLPLWSSPLLLFSLQVPLFLPAHRITTSRSACLELRGHDSMFPPSRCAIRGSWKLASEQRGVAQSAYQIRVTDTSDVLWETGKVLSHQSIHVPYGGSDLRSGQRCTWRVRVWDGNDQPSAWSEAAWWEMGLLHPIDWHAHWIEPGWQEDPNAELPCPY